MIINRTSTQEPKTRNKGIIRASYAQTLAALPFSAVSLASISTMKKLNKLSPEDTITIKKSISQALTDTGLREKGTKAIFVDTFKSKKEIPEYITNLFSADKLPKADEKVIKACSKEVEHFKNKKLYKSLFSKFQGDFEADPEFKKIIDRVSSVIPLFQVKSGSNAFYKLHGNAIVVPNKKLTPSAFHEMGHALNANYSKVGKFLQKNRKLAMSVAGLVGLVGLCTKKKADDETPNKGIGKVTHFIKKNAGVLSFASMMPVVMEEAMATMKGNKIASQMLDKKLLNKVKLTNAIGLSTYLLGALSVGVSTAFAIKVKDNIQAKHEAKVAAKHQAKLAAQQK